MFQLFVTISLDPLQKRTQRSLLCLPEFLFFFFHSLQYLIINLPLLFLLHLQHLLIQHLRLIILLHANQQSNLFPHLYQLLGMLDLKLALLPDLVSQCFLLLQMLLFQFLQTQIGCRLIVTHVIVPCLGELYELLLLGVLNGE